MDPHHVPAGVLGLVQGEVDGMEEVVHRRPRRRVGGDAGPEPADDLAARDRDDVVLAPAAQVVREGEPCRDIGPRQCDEEPLTSPAGQPCVGRGAIAHQLSEADQNRVPGLVAVEVVDGLQPVEVEQDDGKGLADLFGGHDHGGDSRDQVASVVQPGQGIPASQLGQFRPQEVDGRDLPVRPHRTDPVASSRRGRREPPRETPGTARSSHSPHSSRTPRSSPGSYDTGQDGAPRCGERGVGRGHAGSRAAPSASSRS